MRLHHPPPHKTPIFFFFNGCFVGHVTLLPHEMTPPCHLLQSEMLSDGYDKVVIGNL